MNEEIAEINKKYANKEDKPDVFGLTPDDWTNFKDKFAKIVAIANELSNIWSAYNEQRKNEEDAYLAKVEQNAEKRKNRLQQSLDFGLISETEYANRTKKIDQDVDLQKKKIARDQAIREKQINTFKAIVNTASAVVEALPNYILAALVGVAGAAEIAVIQSTPIPEFAKGARINKPTVGLIGEEGREIILSNSIVDDPNLGPVADDLARIQEGKQPNLLGKPQTPNFTGMTKAITNQSTSVVTNNTVINQIDAEGMTIMQNEISNMRNDISIMTKSVVDLKYLRAIITDDDLTEHEEDKELRVKYSEF